MQPVPGRTMDIEIVQPAPLAAPQSAMRSFAGTTARRPALAAPSTTLASSGSMPSVTPRASASSQALAISASRSRHAAGEAHAHHVVPSWSPSPPPAALGGVYTEVGVRMGPGMLLTPGEARAAAADLLTHVVRLAGDALDRCRRRVQQDLHGHRGRRNDPLYRARRTLHTGSGLLTEKQADRLSLLIDGMPESEA